jgi:hypothetical protein
MIKKSIRFGGQPDLDEVAKTLDCVVDAVNEMQTDDLQAKYNALQAKYYAKISECNRLRQEVDVLKNQADPMFKPEPTPCAHEWHYDPDGMAWEQCFPVKCNLCGDKACYCSVPKDQQDRVIKEYRGIRGPEPKALRDGDAFIGEHGIAYVQVADKIRMASTNKVSSDIHIANILDLAAAVQRGEKVVTLTDNEIGALMYRYTYNPEHYRTASDKLRAARGGQ